MANDLSTRKFFSIAILIYLSFISPVVANWTLVTNGYLGSVYLDFDTLKKNKTTVVIWQLQNFYKKDLNDVHSRRLLIEVDCFKDERRVIYLSAHSEQMGRGVVKFVNGNASDWEHPSPKSVGESILKNICKKTNNS